MEIIHALAGSTKSSAGASHSVGDEDCHFRIAAVNIMPVGQEPAGSVRFASLYYIFAFPGTDLPVSLHQLGRIKDVAAQSIVVVAFVARIQQRQIVRRDEEGHSLFTGTGKQIHRFGRK